MFYTKQSLSDKFLFFQYPKVLLYGEKYRGKTKPSERELYILLLDRTKLSIKNNWFDEKERAYCFYPNEALRTILGVSEKTLIKFKKTLTDLGLLYEKKGNNLSNRMYVKQLVVTNNDLDYIQKLEEFEDESLEPQGTVKSTVPRLKKIQSNKKEPNKKKHDSSLDFVVEQALPIDMLGDIFEEEEKPKIKNYSIQEIMYFKEKFKLHYLAYLPTKDIDTAIRKIDGKYLTGHVYDYPSLLNHELNNKAEEFAKKRELSLMKESIKNEQPSYNGKIPFYNWLEN